MKMLPRRCKVVVDISIPSISGARPAFNSKPKVVYKATVFTYLVFLGSLAKYFKKKLLAPSVCLAVHLFSRLSAHMAKLCSHRSHCCEISVVNF